MVPFSAAGVSVSRRLSTSSTVSSAQGSDFEITVKTATVPFSSRLGSVTAATSVAPAISFCRLGRTCFASSGESNSEATSSGPLTPGPKPLVRLS